MGGTEPAATLLFRTIKHLDELPGAAADRLVAGLLLSATITFFSLRKRSYRKLLCSCMSLISRTCTCNRAEMRRNPQINQYQFLFHH